MELGWESFVDSLKIRWMVGRIMMKIRKVGLMIGRIIGHDGSGLHDLIMDGHLLCCSMRNLGDFSS